MGRRTVRRRSGFTLTEVMIGTTIFTVAILGLAAAASTNLKTSTRSRDEVQYWSDAQRVIDSLMAMNIGKVTAGSTTIRGRTISWTVPVTGTTAPQRVDVTIGRAGYKDRTSTTSDVITIYLAKTTPGP